MYSNANKQRLDVYALHRNHFNVFLFQVNIYILIPQVTAPVMDKIVVDTVITARGVVAVGLLRRVIRKVLSRT